MSHHQKTTILILSLCLTGIMTGCIHTSTEIQLPNPDVQPIAKGMDCTAILLGFSYGDNTIAEAMRQGYRGTDRFAPEHTAPIRRLHSVTLVDTAILGLVGNRCLCVQGEP